MEKPQYTKSVLLRELVNSSQLTPSEADVLADMFASRNEKDYNNLKKIVEHFNLDNLKELLQKVLTKKITKQQLRGRLKRFSLRGKGHVRNDLVAMRKVATQKGLTPEELLQLEKYARYRHAGLAFLLKTRTLKQIREMLTAFENNRADPRSGRNPETVLRNLGRRRPISGIKRNTRRTGRRRPR